MERCPNCGAPARPGAKFCTTCGYRLPVTVPATDQPEATGQDSSTVASSWPPPPQRADDPAASDQPDAASTAAEPATDTSADTSADTSFSIPVTSDDDGETGEQAEVVIVTESESETETLSEASAEETTSTDSVVSSTWTAASANSPASTWDTARPVSAEPDEGSLEPDSAAAWHGDDPVDELIDPTGDGTSIAGVTEETVVVDPPASQYEGWSSAVVEELAPPAADHGTNVARAAALLDELRLLLPVLNSGSDAGSEAGERVASQLESALAGTREEGDDRASLRAALTEARDNPRDIQTILGVAQQADAAITLLDDYDRLAKAVRHAIHALRPPAPGIYPSDD